MGTFSDKLGESISSLALLRGVAAWAFLLFDVLAPHPNSIWARSSKALAPAQHLLWIFSKSKFAFYERYCLEFSSPTALNWADGFARSVKRFPYLPNAGKLTTSGIFLLLLHRRQLNETYFLLMKRRVRKIQHAGVVLIRYAATGPAFVPTYITA